MLVADGLQIRLGILGSSWIPTRTLSTGMLAWLIQFTPTISLEYFKYDIIRETVHFSLFLCLKFFYLNRIVYRQYLIFFVYLSFCKNNRPPSNIFNLSYIAEPRFFYIIQSLVEFNVNCTLPLFNWFCSPTVAKDKHLIAMEHVMSKIEQLTLCLFYIHIYKLYKWIEK